jgi:hypothetical protein
MPGEERKFKRSRIVTFIPFFSRERAEADSQTEAAGVAAIGVDVEDGACVAVDVGRRVADGSAALVGVGEWIGVWVAGAAWVCVGEDAGVVLSADPLVGI